MQAIVNHIRQLAFDII